MNKDTIDGIMTLAGMIAFGLSALGGIWIWTRIIDSCNHRRLNYLERQLEVEKKFGIVHASDDDQESEEDTATPFNSEYSEEDWNAQFQEELESAKTAGNSKRVKQLLEIAKEASHFGRYAEL